MKAVYAPPQQRARALSIFGVLPVDKRSHVLTLGGMKIELSLKVTYLPEWDVWCGIRELLQNARDARVEHGAILKVTHKGNTLSIASEGAVLSHRDLLLGQTSKLERGDLAGKFGEGFKLGVLALVRAGHEVKIRTGGEIWTPSIQKSVTFGEDVLVFSIRKTNKRIEAVEITVKGIDKETWSKLSPRLLFLSEPADTVKTDSGTLLLGSEYTGMLFVKGIFVAHDMDVLYGYDLPDAEVDRDRKMIDSFDQKWRLTQIWKGALARRPDLLDKFNHLLSSQKGDVAGMSDYSVPGLPKEAVTGVVDSFREKFGPDAIPVSSLSESAEIEHLGKKGVVVGNNLNAVLTSALGNLASVKDSLRNEVVVKYGWHELSTQEKENLMSGIALVDAVVGLSLDEINVADFRDENLQGMYDNGSIQVAKKHLNDADLVLAILVHETAHRGGGDGSKGHVSGVEGIWSKIVANLRAK